jgi:Na+-transporting NADH:ubiquinone oxidoreductase subunit C
LAINKEGAIVSRYDINTGNLEGDIRPFAIDVKKHQALLKAGDDVAFPLYIYEKDGQKGYVIPLQGAGLWGDIWGNIALASDFNTVVGVNFGHASETPGLGAEIATKAFQEPFAGKHIYDADGNFVSVPVRKNAVDNEVDAISGGTITSTAVSDMLYNDLNFYQNYRNKIVE